MADEGSATVAPTAISVDENETSSADSAYGDSDDAFSDTTSISSSIMSHRYENGRRYHKFREGEYWGPNDEQQNDQLDIAHHMFLVMLNNKLHLAPLHDPKNALDLGCGTGIWTMDFADENPGTEVIGADFSPIQPSFTPPNCKFIVDDVTAPWTYPANHFDFINVRALYGSIANWPNLYQNIYEHLKPGAYMHQLEMAIQFESDDGSLQPDHILSVWSDTFHEAGERFGKSFKAVHELGKWMKDAGFEDIQEIWYKLPVGSWPSDPHLKELGKWNLLHCTQGAEGWGLFLLTNVMKWTTDEARVFIAKFKNGLRDRSVHSYFRTVVLYGRKPGST